MKERNFTYDLIISDDLGNERRINEADTARGYKRSWFYSESNARRLLNNDISFYRFYGYKIVSWAIRNRAGVIEAGHGA